MRYATTFCLLALSLARAQMPGLALTGDPEASAGATLAYQRTDGGVAYDLRGVLYKPEGAGPFAAVILNHGTGGSSLDYGRRAADSMVAWGYAAIAVNYTHVGPQAPCGAPGACVSEEFGASASNVLRGMKAWDILAGLGYVDTRCIMTYGHSRGGFVATELAGRHPAKFSAAGHTAGGAAPIAAFSAPAAATAANITAPYIFHHGDADSIVPIALANRLDQTFKGGGHTYAYHIYAGQGHNDVAEDAQQAARTRAWFAKYGCPQGPGALAPRRPGLAGFSPSARCDVHALDGRLEFSGPLAAARARLRAGRGGVRIIRVTEGGRVGLLRAAVP